MQRITGTTKETVSGENHDQEIYPKRTVTIDHESNLNPRLLRLLKA